MTTYSITNGETLVGSNLYSGGNLISTFTPLATDTISVLSGGTIYATDLTSLVSVVSGGTLLNDTIDTGAVVSTVVGATVSADTILNGGTLVEKGNVNATDLTVSSGGVLNLINNTGTQSVPVYVHSGGQIEFGGIAATTLSALVVTSTASTTTLTISTSFLSQEKVVIAGPGITFTSGSLNSHPVFTFSSDSPLLSSVSSTLCFMQGTLIDTPDGPRAIEAFQAGDMVTVLRDGQRVAEAVRWIGHSSIDLSRHAYAERAAPVRIMAGALGQNLPLRDLVVSPEHCLILDGKCVPAKLLVNGASVIREYRAEPFTYYHLELDRHGILLAEGAPTESYLDTGNRAIFDNADSARQLHPSFDMPTPERWSTEACAPLAQVPDEVAPVWQALAERAETLGYQIPTPTLVTNPDVHLVVDGKRVQPIANRNGRYAFMVPAGARAVTLASRFCIPADKMIPGIRDTRRLGVSVDQMSIRTTTDEIVIPADHPGLTEGWNDVERDGATMWRWTDGAAVIPWDNIDGSAVLTIRCKPVADYPVYDEKLRLVA